MIEGIIDNVRIETIKYAIRRLRCVIDEIIFISYA